jgi:hypothetical protein
MKAKITIVLEYDLEHLRFMRGVDFPESEFMEQVEESVYVDLIDMMRTTNLEHWAEIEVTRPKTYTVDLTAGYHVSAYSQEEALEIGKKMHDDVHNESWEVKIDPYDSNNFNTLGDKD